MSAMGRKRTLGARILGDHPRRESARTVDQRRNVAGIKLAVEGQAKELAILPSDRRGTAKRSAIEHDCRSRREADRAGQLRPASRQVDDLDEMAVTIGL